MMWPSVLSGTRNLPHWHVRECKAFRRIASSPHTVSFIRSTTFISIKILCGYHQPILPGVSAADSDSLLSTPTTDLFQRPTLVLAGFFLEELPHVRLALDAVGGQDIILVVCHPDLLLKPVELVIAIGEPAWDQPMPPQWVNGGGWGKRKVILFSGLRKLERTTILQVLEEGGIDNISSLAITVEDKGIKLGSLLAKATSTSSKAENGENVQFVEGVLPSLQVVTADGQVLSPEEAGGQKGCDPLQVIVDPPPPERTEETIISEMDPYEAQNIIDCLAASLPDQLEP